MFPLPPVVTSLLIANAAVFLLQLSGGDRTLLTWLALWPAVSHPGYVGVPDFWPWQLLSYGFLHGGLMHIGLNMLMLVMFGSDLERYWGSGPFLRYFLFCVLGAGLLQLAVASGAVAQGEIPYPTVGASGGTLGVLLGYGLMFPRRQVMLLIPPIPMPAIVLVLLVGAFELYNGVVGTRSGIAHMAHVGGMLFGYFMILYWRGKLPFKPKRQLRA